MNQSILRLLNTVKKSIYLVVVLLLIVIAGTSAIAAFDVPGGIKMYTVLSGSMEPSIKTGSVVVTRPELSYREGDVITFMSSGNPNPKNSVTHRISAVAQEEGREVFVTKGDANNTPDGGFVTSSQVLGKVNISIPYLGYAVNFAQTQMGLIFLIIIPATLIVYSELLNIKNEAKRLIVERRNRKLNFREKIQVLVGEEEIALEQNIKKILTKDEQKIN
jgi:signal peptidase I